MEPYFITCTTCQARLKVVQEAIIGQIQACPKCRSMVLVTAPPEGSQRNTAHPPDPNPSQPQSPQTNKVDVAADPDTVADSTISALPLPVIIVPNTTRRTSNLGSSSAQVAKPQVPSQSPSENSVAAQVPLRLPISPGQPQGRSSTWVRLRRVVLFVTAGAFGVVMAILAFSWLIPGREPNKVVQKAIPEKVSDPETENKTAEETATQPPPSVLQPPPSVVDTHPDSNAPPHPTSQVSKPASSVKPPEEPTNSLTPHRPVETSTNSVPQETTNPSFPGPNPFEFKKKNVPEKGTNPQRKPGKETDSSSAPSSTVSPTNKLMEGLEKFDALIRQPGAPSDSNSNSMPDSKSRPADSGANASQNQRAPIRRADARSRLQDPIAAIDFSETPFIDFLRFMSEMSTIPITLPPSVLEQAKLSASQPISVRASKTDVRQVLTAALKPLRLSVVADITQLQIAYGEDPSDVQSAQLEVADLLQGGPAASNELQEAIVDMVVPGSWAKSGGVGTIEVEGTKFIIENEPQLVYQTQVFCERLRIARGLKPKSEIPKHHAVAMRCNLASAALAKPISLNFSQFTPFRRIVQRLEADASIRILIDWQSLLPIRWGLESETTLVVAKKSLSETLELLLTRMDLSWRIVDEQTLLVASREKVDMTWDIEFHSVKALIDIGMQPGDILNRVREQVLLVQSQPDTQPQPDALTREKPTGVIRYDAASKSLVASLPQTGQRKLMTALAELSSKAAK